jgi:hypothetical protein
VAKKEDTQRSEPPSKCVGDIWQPRFSRSSRIPQHDLIILGLPAESLLTRIMGSSVIHQILAEANCSVMMSNPVHPGTASTTDHELKTEPTSQSGLDGCNFSKEISETPKPNGMHESKMRYQILLPRENRVTCFSSRHRLLAGVRRRRLFRRYRGHGSSSGPCKRCTQEFTLLKWTAAGVALGTRWRILSTCDCVQEEAALYQPSSFSIGQPAGECRSPE